MDVVVFVDQYVVGLFGDGQVVFGVKVVEVVGGQLVIGIKVVVVEIVEYYLGVVNVDVVSVVDVDFVVWYGLVNQIFVLWVIGW